MRRLASILVIAALLLGTPHAQCGEQCPWQWVTGHWKFSDDSGSSGSVVWNLASDGKAVIGHWRHDDGTTATEMGGWRPDKRVLVSTAYGSTGAFWELVCTKVTEKTLAGESTSRQPDGTVSKGSWKLTKVGANEMESLFEGTAGDERVTIKGTFRRVEPQEDRPSTAEKLKAIEPFEGEWITRVTAREDWVDGMIKAGDVYHMKLEYEWLYDKTGMSLEISVKTSGSEYRPVYTALIGWDAVKEQIVARGIFSRGAVADTVLQDAGRQWKFRRSITRPDGTMTSQIIVVKHIDDKTVTTQLVERDGQPEENEVLEWNRS